MVRQNALKQLISHGSSMLTEQFSGTESDSSAVDSGIGRPLLPFDAAVLLGQSPSG
jgi:hypothetical protein